METGEPDFYLYGGEAGTNVLDTIRSCYKLHVIRSAHGKEVLIVKVDPPLPVGPAFTAPEEHVIGLASRSTLYRVDEFGAMGGSEAVAWQVKDIGGGHYEAITSVGIVNIWKDKPEPVTEGA